MPHEERGVVDQLMQIDRFAVELAVGGEVHHSDDDFFGSRDGLAHLLEDNGHVFIVGGHVVLQVFHSHEQKGEGVFHLVRHPGSETADGFQLFRLDELHLRQFQLFVGIDKAFVEDLQPIFRAFALGDVGGHAGDGDNVAIKVPQRELEHDEGALFGAECDVFFGLRITPFEQHRSIVAAEDFSQLAVEKLPVGAAEQVGFDLAEQLFEPAIDEDVTAGAVFDEDDGGGVIENRLQLFFGLGRLFGGFLFLGAVKDHDHDPPRFAFGVADDAGVAFAPQGAAVFGQVAFAGNEAFRAAAAEHFHAFAVLRQVHGMHDFADAAADEFAAGVAEEGDEGFVGFDEIAIDIGHHGGHGRLRKNVAIHFRDEASLRSGAD